MNFATTPQQQQAEKPQLSTTTATNTSTSSTTTTTTPEAANNDASNCSASNSNSPLPKTFITAQNCNFDLGAERPTPPPRAARAKSAAAKLTLMIKNNESSSSHQAAGDEKEQEQNDDEEEEEKEVCNVLYRRESACEDVSATQANKLNPIAEHSEDRDTTAPTATSSPLASIQQSSEPATAVAATVGTSAPSVVVADTSLPSAPLEAQPSALAVSNSSENCSNASPNNSTSQLADKSEEYCEADSASARAGSAGDSPRRKSSTSSGKGKLPHTPSSAKVLNSLQNSLSSVSGRADEDTVSKSSDTSGELVRASVLQEAAAGDKSKGSSRLSERAKKKSWYNVLYPNYKSRAEDFKKLFKEVPSDERLIVDYSCALQRDILVQGRLYVSQNYVCFHANIFRWETYLTIRWKDVTSITKEKTALVIPNAISICTAKEKYFFATFTTRDKAFLMLFRVWQNTLMNKPMPQQEIWQWVHNCYGDELGLTTDDEDYIDPTTVPCETDGDLDFASALEDNSSVNTATLTAASDYNTPSSQLSLNQITGINKNGHSSTSTSSGGGGSNPNPSKSKTRSYFFSSHKSNLNSSATASASGSDNKASDNNSGGDSKAKMKANAKELTLMSAKPDENVSVNTSASGVGGAGGRASGGSSTAADGAKANNVNDSGGSAGGVKEIKSITTTTHGHDAGKRKVSKNSRLRDESLNKTMAHLPTDISDSSDSDENKIPFVATAECTSAHEGRQLMHTILPINIDTLFNLLFSKSKFLVEFHAMRKTTDTSFGDWITSEDGKKARTVNVTVQLAASVGPKTSKVTEYQEMRECSKPGELYSIDINSVNAGIPYADSFSVLMHYCMVRTIDDHTMLSVHAQIKYKKSIWGVVKGFIEKNTWAGLEDFFTSLLHALQSETCIPPAKGKGRRPRRGTATQIRPIEEVSDAQTKTEPAENMLATHTLAPHLPVAARKSLSGETTGKYKWLSLFVIVLLCFLIVLNVILLLKLWKLEERIEEDVSNRARMPDLASLKQLPNTHQEWIELLRQQEILHETELKKWHKVLQTAIDLLKKVSVVCQTIYNSDKLTQQIEHIDDEL